MSPPPIPENADAMRDHMAWHQIFIGYGMVLIMLMLAVLHQLGFSENSETMSTIGSTVVVAVVIVATLLKRPFNAFQRKLLAGRPALEDGLQWAAIVTLVLLSGATIINGILVLPASGWS